jgi:radical SAM-linked protein
LRDGSGCSKACNPQNMTKATKVRLRFAKCEDLRLVSHHDLMRCLERILRRARVPIALSQGFNPRPKMTFALALGLGIEGRREVVDLELAEPMEPCELLSRLKAVAPAGFEWLEADALAPDAAAPQAHMVEYSIAIPAQRRAAARSAVDTLLASASWPVTRHRPKHERTLDVRRQVVETTLSTEGLLRFRLTVNPEGSIRPEELLEALALRDLLDEGAILSRTNVELVS